MKRPRKRFDDEAKRPARHRFRRHLAKASKNPHGREMSPWREGLPWCWRNGDDRFDSSQTASGGHLMTFKHLSFPCIAACCSIVLCCVGGFGCGGDDAAVGSGYGGAPGSSGRGGTGGDRGTAAGGGRGAGCRGRGRSSGGRARV